MNEKICVESGFGDNKFVTIFEVHLVTLNDRDLVYMRFFSRNDALDYVYFMRRNFSDQYKLVYLDSQIVFL